MGKEYVIKGSAKTRSVTIDGKWLNPRASLRVRNHSPDGFCWGYLGSGPAQLALAILLETTNPLAAERHYQLFKEKVLAVLDMERDFEIHIDIQRWIADGSWS